MATRFAILGEHRGILEALSLALSSFDGLVSVGIGTKVDDVVDLARRHRPDVLLIDHQFRHGATGGDLASLHDGRGSTRLIAITAFDSLAAYLLDAGFEQVVSKNSPLEVWADAIRTPHQMNASDFEFVERVQFSRRQREVLDLMGEGSDPKNIADALTISIHTARSHVKAVMALLDAPTQLAAVITAIQEGYLLPPMPRQGNI